MTSRDGISRSRLRPSAPPVDQVLTPLGRVSSTIPSIPNPSTLNTLFSTTLPTTVVQNSGNIRARHTITNPNSNTNNILPNQESDFNSLGDFGIFDGPTPLITFDAEKFCSDIKENRNDGKRLEQLILNAIHYFLTTSKRAPQQMADYTVLTFLSWAASIHAEIFRKPTVLRAMCFLLKGSTLTKTMKAYPNGNNTLGIATTPYALVCQILWLAFKVRIQESDRLFLLWKEDSYFYRIKRIGQMNSLKSMLKMP